jgi:hypothetical protein
MERAQKEKGDKHMRAFLACIATLILSAGAAAQTNRGGISGTVTDKSGAVMADITVTITNLGTNETYRVTTSKQGAYSAQNLDPVVYRVEVDLPGFKKAIVEHVKVDTATIEAVNLSLEPGDVNTEVRVTDQAPLQNSENGTLGQTISERLLTDVPLLNRSVLDLAVLTPNTSGDVGTADPTINNNAVPVPGFNLSVNGGRPGSTYMIADGVSNTGVGLAREVVSFSPETVQEVTVQTSSYSAAFGHTGGGVINVTTKSGTNEYHGAATVYHRNPATNAAPWSNATVNRPTSNLRYTQMSFDLGGPVRIPKLYNGRDRTFFFVAVEPRYESDATQNDTLLPTPAMLNGDFSNLTNVNNGWAPTSVVNQFQATLPAGRKLATPFDSTIYQVFNPVMVNGQQQLQPIILGTATGGCGAGFTTYCPFPGNALPSNLMDPVAKKILQFLPKPGPYFIDGNGDLANYVGTSFVRDDHTRYFVRVDELVTKKNRAFFRFTSIPLVGIYGNNSPLNTTGATYSSSRQYAVGDTQTLSASMYNEVRFNYSYARFSGTFSPEFDIMSGRNLSTDLGLPSLTKGGLPLFTVSAASNRRTVGADIGAGSSQINDNNEKQYQIIDNLFISHGNMTWTFGFELNQQSLDTFQYNFAAGGRYGFRFNQTSSNGGSSGNGGIVWASFLEGVINDNLLATSLVPYHYNWRGAAGFVQNDWKVRPNLTVNLGLRYSLQIPRGESSNLQGYFVPAKAQNFPVLDANGNLSTLTSVRLVAGGSGTLNLPTPISSVPVQPFAYSGVAGNSIYVTPVNWTDFEPRLGFAYAPRRFGLNNFVIRGGYGISHVPLTGQNRQPIPNFGGPAALPSSDPNSAQTLSANPPNLVPQTPQQAVGVSGAVNGLSYINSINLPGAILSTNTRTPYAQNWNLSVSRSFGVNTVVEVAYVGAKGTHLFLPQINVNLFDQNWVSFLEANGVSAFNSKILDPLGRCVPGSVPDITGSRCSGAAPSKSAPTIRHDILQVPIGTLYSAFPGFSNVFTFDDASADSIRHAGYISVVHRPVHGLTWSANYTYGKSLDDASNGSPDKNVLTSSNLPGGQITFGGTPKGDRSVSTFDVKHVLNFVGVYDLPFGRGQRFLGNAWAPLDTIVGGWTVSGVERFYSGFPAVVTQAFANDRGTTVTHDIRPNLVPGVPIINPLYDSKCPVGNLCQPYINPAAFEEAPVGQLGNAPRTLDGARGPWQQTLDLSVQKNFKINERLRIQLRVDALNALNHPIFRTVPNNFGGTDIWGGGGGGLNTGTLNSTDYNNWAIANGQPQTSQPGGTTLLNQINAMINSFRFPAPPGSNPGAVGQLPADFFTVPVPQNFPFADVNSFDIRTLNGYKLFRVRQDLGTSAAGRLSVPNQSSRYLQFGLRIFF